MYDHYDWWDEGSYVDRLDNDLKWIDKWLSISLVEYNTLITVRMDS